MIMRITHALTIAGLLIAGSAHAAQHDLLPLQSGTYVRDGASVQDAPLAALIIYDGAAISGPHSSACRSTVLSHHGAMYRLSTTCAALGDGTPAVAYTETQRIVVRSRTTMRFAHGEDVASYRLAPTS
jgi:hypothetical protein